MMILYGEAAHTFTLRQFIIERGNLTLEVQHVDMNDYEHRRIKYRTTVNQRGECPALRLDDGSILTETLAICQYLDEVATDGTSLFGDNAQERAVTHMWLRRADIEIVQPLLSWFQNNPDSVDYYRGNRLPLPEAILPCKIAVNRGLNLLDDEMDDGRQFICGNKFTMADIYIYSMLKAMSPVASWLNPTGQTNVHTWMGTIGARPASSQAAQTFGPKVDV